MGKKDIFRIAVDKEPEIPSEPKKVEAPVLAQQEVKSSPRIGSSETSGGGGFGFW